MNIVHSFINHACTGLHKLVDDPADKLFVAWDRVCRDYDKILRSYRDLSVLVVGHTRKRGHRLALASGSYYDELLRRYLSDLVYIDEYSLRKPYIVELDSRGEHIYHTSARDRDFASCHLGIVDYLLNAVDIAGESRNDDALALSL